MSNKPVVLYDASIEYHVKIGSRALVHPLNHPSELVSNTTYILTSNVVRIGENGEFETENTIYRPSHDPQ